MADISVEVVFALADRQELLTVDVPADSTVDFVIEQSEIQAKFAGVELDALSIGIWGREVERQQTVKAGDRIEIYRPLEMDPREARRQLAEAGRTMSGSDHN